MSKFSTYQLSDGGLYIGELNDNGLPHSSQATCTWPNGTAYRGSWINGTICGVGTMYENGAIKYRGYWWKGELIHIFGTEELPRPETKLPKNKNKIAALLVGCSYEDGNKPLPCCVHEVDEIGKKMSAIGIDVTVLKNATREEIQQGLIELSNKNEKFDHAIFYFSGHGAILGGYHVLLDIESEPMALETNVIRTFNETNYKNIIIVHDACNVILPISQETIDQLHDQEQMIKNNHTQARNLLYAFSSLNGKPSFASSDKLGMFALAFIENLQKKKVPVVRMFDDITKFVLDYSQKVHGCYLETPNVTKVMFDEDFCLYEPEE